MTASRTGFFAPGALTALVVATVTSATSAQDLLPKGAPELRPVLLQNGTIHTISAGTVLGGTVWFHEGKIRGVTTRGVMPAIPPGTEPRKIDLQGRDVYPGMIAAATTLGLQEIGQVRQSVDVNEIGDMTPEVLAAVALNPDSTAIPVARSNGVLAAAVFPGGGLIAGRASIIQLDGWTNADMTVIRDAGPVVSWPAMAFGQRPRRRSPVARETSDPNERARQRRAAIDRAFRDARAWSRAHRADPNFPIDVRHQALTAAARGEKPVFLLADEVEAIESAVHWATDLGLRPVIVGGRDAHECARLLVEREVPVILQGVHNMPRRSDSAFDEPFTLPARLHRAGVKFCIASGDGYSNERNLPYHAATAAAFGLDRREALAAVTLRVAEILGCSDRLGALKAGCDATLFVCDGNPLELTTSIELAFIRGRQVDLRNKQTELAKKYRERYRQLRESK